MPVEFNQAHTGHWSADQHHRVMQHRHDDLEDDEDSVMETPLDPALAGVIHFDPYKNDSEQERAEVRQKDFAAADSW